MPEAVTPRITEKYLVIAAEASSAKYAEMLIEELRTTSSEAATKKEFFGIGSAEMQKLGFRAIAKSEDMALVGLKEVVKHLPYIRQVFKSIVNECKVDRPKVAILLDYPDFNFRLAKELTKLKIPVIYYISPQIWAWRKSRVELVKKYVTQLAVIFPFEVDFYKKQGVSVHFVGHPILEALPSANERQILHDERSRYGVLPSDNVLALMPGSRGSEIQNHLDVQLKVASRLQAEFSNLKVMLFVAPTQNVTTLKAKIQTSTNIIIVQRDPFEMIPMADVVLCASGTATLMVGLCQKPMVIMYKVSRMTAFVVRRLFDFPKFFGLPNLILDRLVSPELFQEQANESVIYDKLKGLLNNPSEREEQRVELAKLENLLGSKGATRRVASLVATAGGDQV
ncbi:MAG: lipid-A-disaccharide synthase [Bdellovibrionales bacterium CG10_big_fil_rev_8_21_14_0_10_45_34]|nr:MAG: lipid-A-disaccharide synthase [Bdellovibrionales bacterium CG10_big_fil_rev_8_21_14_0_10_45_34]